MGRPKGSRQSEETRRKISQNSAHIWKGKHLSVETRRKLANAHLGKRGYKHSEETKKKISLANKGNGAGKVRRKCKNCAKEYFSWPSEKRSYCSVECSQKKSGYWLGKKRPTMSDDWKKKIGEKSKGNKNCKGLTPWNKGMKMSKAHIEKLKGKRLKAQGENNHSWKGGITPINAKIRNSLEMKLWRKSCFERDGFTCQKTGEGGGKLVVHHINNFADFPELRTSIQNGITLNEKAHKEFHTIYGKRNNTREQLENYLDKKL